MLHLKVPECNAVKRCSCSKLHQRHDVGINSDIRIKVEDLEPGMLKQHVQM